MSSRDAAAAETYQQANARLDAAIHFAVERHAGQLRKVTTCPYIVHPLETMCILVSMRADINLLIAGVLHDTIEDTGTTRDELESRFGSDAASLVIAHSEDKSRTWEERKAISIEETRQGTRRLKMLVLADKVANLRSMYTDHKQVGEKLWERFHAPKDRQEWYYKSMYAALSEMGDDSDTAEVYREMAWLCGKLFRSIE